ncbi:gluconate:H+ symporter [Cytophagaceae bacterium ABcell3]|nr:gluconate:H+ symporter [Cytophagaceae bacterium ABcell3]
MDYSLLFAVLTGITLLLILILYFKLQAFLSLLISSIAVGLLAGIPGPQIISSMQEGMAGTLGFIAIVVGLGALFGGILENSGGVHSLANYLINKSGQEKTPLVLMVTGFLISIPVFFDVAFVILAPVVYALQRKTGKPLLYFGVPLLAGLAVTHAFIPPTPGPVAVADILQADLGLVIISGLIAGIPAALLAGPLFGKFIAKRIKNIAPPTTSTSVDTATLPSPKQITVIIGLPIFLILTNTVVNTFQDSLQLSSLALNTLTTVGHPFIALLLANLAAWYFLGIKRGQSRKQLLQLSNRSLEPAGIIILITGAGGVFKQMLTDTGAGKMLAMTLADQGLSIMFFAFLSAAVIRILQGSSTVAMITAAGLTASLLEGTIYSDMQKALLVIAIASGASIMSHVNDSGFWLVSKYYGLNEKQTLQSWTIMTTIIAFTGFTTVFIISLIIQ